MIFSSRKVLPQIIENKSRIFGYPISRDPIEVSVSFSAKDKSIDISQQLFQPEPEYLKAGSLRQDGVDLQDPLGPAYPFG